VIKICSKNDNNREECLKSAIQSTISAIAKDGFNSTNFKFDRKLSFILQKKFECLNLYFYSN
jgi:predicted GNAT superfamily acetyltransferase